MKIDLHVHSLERSPCGKASAIAQINAAIEVGLDAIVFTDHRRLFPAEILAQLNDTYAPFCILGGIEITIEGEDLLVLGIQDPALEASLWTYPDLHAYVRERDGFLALAHPFRYCPEIQLPLKQFPPDALEVYSCNTPLAAAGRIIELAQLWDLPPLCNSDAHAVQSLGKHYNLLDQRPRDEKELIQMLTAGMFTAVRQGSGDTCTERLRRSHPPA
jgi:predicted metal-dependent phosphoesterase TrpH